MHGKQIFIVLLAGVGAAAAQEAPRSNWQVPGAIQQPKGPWLKPGPIQVPGAIQKPGQIQQAGEIQQPKPGPLQVPGEIQKPGRIEEPKGPWQTPGEIQAPGGGEAVKVTTSGCENRLSVLADALFDFDKADLRPDAEALLDAALPEIVKAGGQVARVEGHTDGKGSDAYNMKLGEARGRTVRDWLGAKGAIPAATPVISYGKRMPIAPNTTPDGYDDPDGRQKNRRVEIVFETCKI